jgi:hypothetical protein
MAGCIDVLMYYRYWCGLLWESRFGYGFTLCHGKDGDDHHLIWVTEDGGFK